MARLGTHGSTTRWSKGKHEFQKNYDHSCLRLVGPSLRCTAQPRCNLRSHLWPENREVICQNILSSTRNSLPSPTADFCDVIIRRYVIGRYVRLSENACQKTAPKFMWETKGRNNKRSLTFFFGAKIKSNFTLR